MFLTGSREIRKLKMAGVRDRGHYWQIWWIAVGNRQWGRLEKIDYTKKRDAENEASARERDGTVLIRRSAAFKDYATKFLHENKTPTLWILEKFGKFIERFDEFLLTTNVRNISGITETVFKDYIIYCRQKLASSTINREIEFLKQILRDAMGRGIVPLWDLKTIKEEKITPKLVILPTRTERENILKWVQENQPLYYVWLYFIATRGWRMGELREMKISDIDLENRLMYVQHTKTDEPRQETLTEEDCIVLIEHLSLLKKLNKYSPAGFLIPSKRSGKPVSRNTLLKIVKRASKELFITKNITNHIFRHWVVSSILNSGQGIATVKAITGHKDEDTIYRHYAHSTPEDIKAALTITRIHTGFVPGSVPGKE